LSFIQFTSKRIERRVETAASQLGEDKQKRFSLCKYFSARAIISIFVLSVLVDGIFIWGLKGALNESTKSVNKDVKGLKDHLAEFLKGNAKANKDAKKAEEADNSSHHHHHNGVTTLIATGKPEDGSAKKEQEGHKSPTTKGSEDHHNDHKTPDKKEGSKNNDKT
jgi:hypothetical protein